MLHKSKTKDPRKFSPQELKNIVGLNLKFIFEDALLPFNKTAQKVKDFYFVDGSVFDLKQILPSQNYCYIESTKLRFAGELKNGIYQVDISYPGKNKVLFSYVSINEQWRLVCQGRNHFYLQDLIETLGEKITVLE